MRSLLWIVRWSALGTDRRLQQQYSERVARHAHDDNDEWTRTLLPADAVIKALRGRLKRTLPYESVITCGCGAA